MLRVPCSMSLPGELIEDNYLKMTETGIIFYSDSEIS